MASPVDEHRQFFKNTVGLLKPWAYARQLPLSDSFCQHVAASGDPLVIHDAQQHEYCATLWLSATLVS